jgi:hypothetical protein
MTEPQTVFAWTPSAVLEMLPTGNYTRSAGMAERAPRTGPAVERPVREPEPGRGPARDSRAVCGE